MGFWTDLIGTTETAFKIGKGKSTLDASGLTAARTHVLPDAGGTLALTGPCFSAYMSASQTLPSGAFTKLNFDATRFDTHGAYSTANNRFTPGVPGKYIVSSFFDYVGSTGLTVAILSIFKNGSEHIRLQDLRGPSGTIGAGGGTDIITLNSTDYIEMHAYLSATSPVINYSVLPQLNGFSAAYVGP